MGKRNKSKRFIQQGKETVARHAEKFPYRMTFAEAEALAKQETNIRT